MQGTVAVGERRPSAVEDAPRTMLVSEKDTPRRYLHGVEGHDGAHTQFHGQLSQQLLPPLVVRGPVVLR